MPYSLDHPSLAPDARNNYKDMFISAAVSAPIASQTATKHPRTAMTSYHAIGHNKFKKMHGQHWNKQHRIPRNTTINRTGFSNKVGDLFWWVVAKVCLGAGFAVLGRLFFGMRHVDFLLALRKAWKPSLLASPSKAAA